MKEKTDIDSFIEAIKNNEACYLQIQYQDLLKTIEALIGVGLAGDPSLDNWKGLSGLCPQCSAWIGGTVKETYLLFEEIKGKKKSVNTQYEEMKHTINLNCPNPSCMCTDIILIWRGDEGIRNQIDQHLQRLRTHLIRIGNDKRLDLMDKLEDGQAMRFVQDTIFGLERRCINSPLILGRKISNIVIWVTVLPPTDGAIERAFPKGYNAYLSMLLNHSGYDNGDTAVAHWIAFDYQGQKCLNLALHSEKNSLGTDQEFALLPAEILQELGNV